MAKKIDKQKNLLYSLYISIILYVILTTAYFLYFFNNKMSYDLESWGQFGDYIGGVFNPIIGVITLYITIRLQRVLVDFTKSIGKQQTKAQIESQKILLNTQMLYDIAKDFTNNSISILRKISVAHHAQDPEATLIALRELRSLTDTFIWLHASLFFGNVDYQKVIPYNHVHIYINLLETNGEAFFEQTDRNFYLEMISLFIASTSRKMFASIQQRAQSPNIFYYDMYQP